MSLSVFSFPRYVYQQDAEPTGAIKGALWVDTNATPVATYVYSGTAWNSITSDVDYLADEQLEMALNILINSAAASSTLNDWDDMAVDIFSDANGTSDTIDTESTTAIYASPKYGNGSMVDEAHGITMDSTQGNTGRGGMRIEVGASALTLNSVTKHSSVTATHAQLCVGTDTSNVIATAVFSGNVATFSEALSASTAYMLVCYSSGASYTHYYKDNNTFPQIGTLLNWTGCSDGNGEIGTAYHWNITGCNVGVTPAGNAIVQTNPITITADPSEHQVYCHNSISGTSSIDYDISFDNGLTWVEGQSLNQKNSSVHAGSQMILKLNLKGTGAGNIATADDYGVLLYY